MAVFTRINGDAQAVVNVGTATKNANAVIINTGIASPITAYKITGQNGNLAAELTTGGAVETILRAVAGNATILAAQVDSNFQLSVLVERSGWVSDAAVLASIPTGNIGATGNCWIGATTAVSSTGGIKLA